MRLNGRNPKKIEIHWSDASYSFSHPPKSIAAMLAGEQLKATCRKMFKAASKSRWGKDNKKRGGVEPPLANVIEFLNSQQPASEFEPASLRTNNPRVIGLAAEDLECVKNVAMKLQLPKTRRILPFKNRGFSEKEMDAVEIYVFDLHEQDVDEPTTATATGEATPKAVISPSPEINTLNADDISQTTDPTSTGEATPKADAIPASEMMQDVLPELISPSAELNTLNADATAYNCKYFMIILLPLGKPCSTAKFFKAVRKSAPVGCVLPACYAKMITRTGWKSLESRNLNKFKHTALKEGKKSVRARHPYLLRTTVGEASSIGQ